LAPRALAEVMKDAGYKTIAFNGGTPFLHPNYGYARGFDGLADLPIQRYSIQRQIGKVLEHFKLKDVAVKVIRSMVKFTKYRYVLLNPKRSVFPSAMTKINKCIEVVKNIKSQGFFIWLHLMDVHGPYTGLWEANIIERFWMTRYFQLGMKTRSPIYIKWGWQFYKRALQLVDNAIGVLINSLDTLGILGDTLIIITSDHGEEFLEHGDYDHKPKPYDEIIHVPLIVFLKSETFTADEKQRERQKLVSLVDLPPSIVHLLFGKQSSYFVGKPVLLNNKVLRDYVLSEGYQKPNDPFYRHDPTMEGIRNWCIRTKEWKYMQLQGKEMVFDLLNDKKEQNPQYSLSGTHIKTIQRFLEELKHDTLRVAASAVKRRLKNRT